MELKIPKHLAIILDGNGRWAQLQNKPRTYGHKKGMSIIQDIAIECKNLGIEYLTVFCFSTENWNRPKSEVDYLMKVPEEILKSENIDKYNEHGISLKWIGRKEKVPNKTKESLETAVEKTKKGTKMVLTLALDYGSDEELQNSIKNMANNLLNDKIKISEISYEEIKNRLYTTGMPNVDLLIRTGGEKRLSNFMLLQSSYAELYFTNVFWPDFDINELNIALEDYSNRDRRYGRIKENG